MFIQNTTYVNLLLFLECASRLKHAGLNKYFWHIYKVPGGVLNFELGTDVRPEVSTTTL